MLAIRSVAEIVQIALRPTTAGDRRQFVCDSPRIRAAKGCNPVKIPSRIKDHTAPWHLPLVAAERVNGSLRPCAAACGRKFEDSAATCRSAISIAAHSCGSVKIACGIQHHARNRTASIAAALELIEDGLG